MHARVVKSASHGAVVGMIYLLLAIAVGLLRGVSISALSGPSLTTLAGLCIVGGAFIGAVAGWLEPYIASLGRAILVYAFAAFPVAIWANVVYFPASRMENKDPTVRIVTLAVFLGVIGGTAYWKHRTKQPSALG